MSDNENNDKSKFDKMNESELWFYIFCGITGVLLLVSFFIK